MVTQCAPAVFVKRLFQRGAEPGPEAPRPATASKASKTRAPLLSEAYARLEAEGAQETGDSLTPGDRGQIGKEGRQRSALPPSRRRGES